MTMKTGTGLGLIAFGITLAYYVSLRLSTDALDFAVGVMCGIVASLPISLGLLLALTRHRDQPVDDRAWEESNRVPGYSAAKPQMPQVIVLAPPQWQNAPGGAPFNYQSAGDPRYSNYSAGLSGDMLEGRDWKIIGDDS
jgi:hypothetical protein